MKQTKTIVRSLRYIILIPFLFVFSKTAHAAFPESPGGDFTHIAVTNGKWHLASTWQGGVIPSDGAIIQIPQGIIVKVAALESARVKFIRVDGELRLINGASSRLLVETIFVSPTGTFRIGTSKFPVVNSATAELVFINDGEPIDRNWDPNEKSRGLISEGVIRIYGSPKTHMVEMSSDVVQGSTSLSLQAPSDWEVGDELVIAGTQFIRGGSLQDEVAQVSSIGPGNINLNQPTQFSHLRVDPGMNIHIANLTRNVVIRSESTDVPLRGHVMLRNPNVEIRHTAFVDLGRSNKTIPADEIIVDTISGDITPNLNIQNRRGRYSLHFHRNCEGGTCDPSLPAPSKILGTVVRGTPGWGYVNHESYVDFQQNVAYDFAGAGFVTEAGNEMGSFIDNIAVHGTGVPGEYFPIRQVFESEDRPQPLSDFGFAGDCFWFQGPALRVKNNVANSCNGAGMIWFATGGIDIDNNQYMGFPSDQISTVYAGFPGIENMTQRSWDYASNLAVIADLPILEMDGLDSYANLVGFKLRFNNRNSDAFYGEAPYFYNTHQLGVSNRITQTVRNLRLWNNEQAFRARYVAQTDWVDVKAVNKLRYDLVDKHYIGAELWHSTDTLSFTNLSMSGYPLAAWMSSKTDIHDYPITGGDFQNYVARDTRDNTFFCQRIAGVSSTSPSVSSVMLNWSEHPEAERFLVRYRVEDEIQWNFWNFMNGLEGRETSTILTGLEPGKTYEYQMIAGCSKHLNTWSTTQTFNTN